MRMTSLRLGHLQKPWDGDETAPATQKWSEWLNSTFVVTPDPMMTCLLETVIA